MNLPPPHPSFHLCFYHIIFVQLYLSSGGSDTTPICLCLLQPCLLLFLLDEFFVEFVGAVQQKVGQKVGGIVRHVLTQIDQAFGQVRHHVVHEILADRLRALVKKITFSFPYLFQLGSLFPLNVFSILARFLLNQFPLSRFLVLPARLFFLPRNQCTNFV